MKDHIEREAWAPYLTKFSKRNNKLKREAVIHEDTTRYR